MRLRAATKSGSGIRFNRDPGCRFAHSGLRLLSQSSTKHFKRNRGDKRYGCRGDNDREVGLPRSGERREGFVMRWCEKGGDQTKGQRRENQRRFNDQKQPSHSALDRTRTAAVMLCAPTLMAQSDSGGVFHGDVVKEGFWFCAEPSLQGAQAMAPRSPPRAMRSVFREFAPRTAVILATAVMIVCREAEAEHR